MKLTRIIILILIMCFLAGCSQPAEAPTQAESVQGPVFQYTFSRETFPKMDGSTSTVPLGQAIASVLLGETREEVSDLIQFNKTYNSYRYLMNGDADILIAAEPAETIWTEKKELGFEWEMKPFAIDGLVFIVNEANPVDSLTIEQVQRIYSGAITNWSQVGGDDLEIMAFQRNEEAGSQTAMLKHVMKDIPMMEAPKEYSYASMDGLLAGIAAYNDTAASIGYTMYYYAEDMQMAEGLKILKVEGVKPNDETIRSGEYPFLNNYYAVINANLTEDDPARVMYEWLLSEGGQRLVANEGYVSVMDVGADSGPLWGDTVRTYWSKLDSYDNKALYTYLEPRAKDGLLHPRNDYSKLLPYIGAVASNRSDIVRTMGLVTDDGQVVTEPVYSSIYYLGQFLILYQEELLDVEYSEYGYAYGYTEYDYTIAAMDGSWVKRLGICDSSYLLEDDVLVIFEKDGSMTVLGSDGGIISELPASVFTDHFGEDYSDYYLWRFNLDGYLCMCSDYRNPSADALIIDVYTGTIVTDYPKSEIVYPETNFSETPEIDGYEYVYTYTDQLTNKKYYKGQKREQEDVYIYEYDLLNENGQVIFSDFNVSIICGGYASTIEDDYFCYYSIETGELIFRFPIRVTND